MKKTKEKSLSQVLIWQTAGRFILQGINFLTAPIFTRLLTTSDYGKVSIYTTWVALCSLFVGLQTSGSIANAKIKYGDDKMNGYLSSIMTISVISFIFILVISILFNQALSKLLDLRSDLVILLVMQGFTSFCVGFYTIKLIQYKQAEKNFIFSLVVSIISTGLAIVFLVNTQSNKYVVKIYGNAIPTIVFGFIIILYIYRKGKKVYDREYWKYCLGLTLPLILHGLGGLVLVQSDRIMLQRMIGAEITGIYSFAYSVALIVQVIWLSFNTSWIPFYYEYKKNNQNEIIIARSKSYIVVFSIIVMGFILVAPEVYKIMSPKEYWSGISLIPLIAMAYYLNFLYGFPVNFEFFNGKTRLISIGTVFAAAINIGCNSLLIPAYAGVGAAISTLISYAFLFIFHEIIARHIIKNFEYTVCFYFIGLIPVSITVVLFYFIQDQWIVRWAIGIVLGIYLLIRIINKRSIF